MRATFIYGAADIGVTDAPDPKIIEPTDGLVQVTRACVCGSALHPYHSAPLTPGGKSIGHELIGVVTKVGAEVRTVAKGDFVIAPFAISGVCEFCRAGLQTHTCVPDASPHVPPLACTASSPASWLARRPPLPGP